MMLLSRDTALAALALAATAPQLVGALNPDICATFNTGNTDKMSSNLQSNGLCHDHCFGKYAFSITKGYDCWCSNFAPSQAVTVQLSDCNFPCYGYPEEPCGGSNGAYSYVRLRNVAVSGTSGSTGPTKSTSQPESTNDPESTSEPPSSASESVTEPETSSSTTESSTSQTSEPSSTAVRTVTADGTIKTVFVGPTDQPQSGDTDRADGEVVGNNGGGSGGVSKGALAGIIVGVALGVIAIIGVGLWFFFRRRKSQQEHEDYQEDPSIRGSSSGMMGSQRPEMSMGGGSPGSPNTSSNRNSALMIDPRMDPFKQGLYVRSNSHESINTLRDDHDYSRRIQQRTLRATNPDPDTEG